MQGRLRRKLVKRESTVKTNYTKTAALNTWGVRFDVTKNSLEAVLMRHATGRATRWPERLRGVTPALSTPRLGRCCVEVVILLITRVLSVHVSQLSEPRTEVGQIVKVQISFIGSCSSRTFHSVTTNYRKYS